MKILNGNNIERTIENLKKNRKKIVFTNGCFDILHVGHLRYLKEAKSYGDILVVGVNSDSSVRRIKGKKRPYVPEDERVEMLAALESVDYVVMFEEDTPIEILKRIKPDIHIKGGDYKEEELPEAKIVKENGGIVKIVSLIQGKSTTNIIKEILNREDNL